MKKLLSVVTIVTLILVLTTTSFAYNKESPPYSAANTYFIAFESHVDKNVIKSHGGETIKQFKYMPVVTAKLSDKAATNLAKNPNIAYIEKDATIHINSQVVPWGVEHINATSSHDLGYTGQGIKVGIIDTGIDYTHEDLNVASGITFIEGTTDYMDDNVHGTHAMASPHVAGSAALLWEANPNLSNVEIRNLLNDSAIYLGDSFEYGNGLVDCLK